MIDAGAPGVAADANEFDQRGTPFVRVANDRIDMGAFESESVVVPQPSADFDDDDDVDGADFLAWQRGFSIIDTATSGDGDANEDGDVDGLDLAIWQQQFGTSTPVGLASVLSPAASLRVAAVTGVIDQALAQVVLPQAVPNIDDIGLVADEPEIEVPHSDAVFDPLVPAGFTKPTANSTAVESGSTDDRLFSDEVLDEIFASPLD